MTGFLFDDCQFYIPKTSMESEYEVSLRDPSENHVSGCVTNIFSCFSFCVPCDISKSWMRSLYKLRSSSSVLEVPDWLSNSLRVRIRSCFIWNGTLWMIKAQTREWRTEAGDWCCNCWSRKLVKSLNFCQRDLFGVVWFLFSFIANLLYILL